MINGSKILVTGGTGSWGHEVVSQLLSKYNPEEIRIFSRGEHKQVAMKKEFQNIDKIKFIIGDIRDKKNLNYATKDIDIIFHLAALKHVPVCEENMWEAVLTNIYGTQNLVECALENEVKMMVDISTDKAVDPFNLYGITKACGEKIVIGANNNYIFRKTKFVCIRGGNVIGTNGSVIPLFRKQIKENNEITITEPEMTRFLMSTKEAIGLIFVALENAQGGEIFVMRMSSTKVETLAHTIISLFGNNDTKIQIIGSRPGEKMDEVLISKNESSKTKILNEKYYVILPQYKSEKLTNYYSSFPSLEMEEFSSANTYILCKDELKSILEKEAWLFQNKLTNLADGS